MANPNNLRTEVTALANKLSKDALLLAKKYSELQKEIEGRFRDEFRDQNGRIDGLEDFYQLSMLIKRNAQTAARAYSMLAKLHNIEGYNIEIEKEDVENLIEELTEA